MTSAEDLDEQHPGVDQAEDDRGQHGADVFGRRLLALSRREEILGKAKLIVDFDQEVGQFHAAHVLRQPGFEAGQTVLSFLVQFLGRFGG